MSIRDELQGLWDIYVAAYRAGDAAGCVSIFADGAEMHSPYAPPASGRAAIEALHGIWTRHAAPKQNTCHDRGRRLREPSLVTRGPFGRGSDRKRNFAQRR